jgi:hypothetical protein
LGHFLLIHQVLGLYVLIRLRKLPQPSLNAKVLHLLRILQYLRLIQSHLGALFGKAFLGHLRALRADPWSPGHPSISYLLIRVEKGRQLLVKGLRPVCSNLHAHELMKTTVLLFVPYLETSPKIENQYNGTWSYFSTLYPMLPLLFL